MIQINRKLEPGRYKIPDAFPDIRQDTLILEIFGSKEEVDCILDTIYIKVVDVPHYMNVDNNDGTINVGLGHLKQSEPVILYLDIIHELFHVKQQRKGIDLYDRSVAYVDRQTEIEAYEFTVKAAREIGLTDKEILDYLWVEWITPEDHVRLAKRLKVKIESTR